MTVLDRVPTDRIAERAAQVRLGPLLLTIVAAVLYAIGWLARWAVRGTALVALWALAAVALGWRDASLHQQQGQRR